MSYKVKEDTVFAKALGLTLRTLRRLRGHKIIVVHGATGFSETSISSWETGKNMPSLQNLRALAGFYKVRLSTVIENTEKAVMIMTSETSRLPSNKNEV